MSTDVATKTSSAPEPGARARKAGVAPIPLTRVVSVELRKMFDTRSGFWLMITIAVLAVLAAAGVIVFGSAADMEYSNFAAAFGIPMGILLPVVAILSVTSEWSQRTGLTTFTYVPHRGRVILAKAICAVVVGVVAVLVAFGIGALGNLLGAAVKGTDAAWDISLLDALLIILANVLGLMIGFMLGVLVRNSPGAIVGYFVYDFVVPTISAVLAQSQDWWEKVQGWFDFNYALGKLYDGGLTAHEWAQLGVSGLIWLALPLAIGLTLVLRSEVK